MSIPERLHHVLRHACEDALFAVAGSSLKALSVVREQRAAAHDAIARGESAVVMADFEAWLASLTAAVAGDFAPWFVPMHDAIEAGMTLHGGPRGLRAVIPIGVDEARARLLAEGVFAVRVARAVSSAGGGVASESESRALELLIEGLGVPEAEARVLRAEAPIPIAAMELPELDAKKAKVILRGAWQVAASDGLDDAEREAIDALVARLGVDVAALEPLRSEELAAVEDQRKLGRALVDVVRYVAAALPAPEASAFALAAVHLSVPPLDRAEALRIVTTNATTPLVESHDLDRGDLERVLAAGWLVALAVDPSMSLRAALRARHDHAATHLDAARVARSAREAVEEYLDAILDRSAQRIGA